MRRTDDDKIVLMVGTEPGRSGGIAALVQGYLEAGFFDLLGIDYVSTHRVGGPVAKIRTYLSGMARIASTMHHYRLVHIHTASWWSFRRLYPVIALAQARRKRIVIHLHGGQFDSYYRTSLPVEQFMIRRGFSAADRVIVLSEDWFDRLGDFCDRSKMFIVPNGVELPADPDGRAEKADHFPRRLLFLGDIIRRKGVYDLIDALAHVAQQIPSFEASICGRGEIEQAKRHAAERGVADRVSFPGWVGGAEKEALLQSAHVFALPSHAECLPMGMLEAMARGIPVVATRVGGVPDIIDDGCEGYLVAAGDSAALADAIVRLLADGTHWQTMAAAARAKVFSRFSLDHSLERLRMLYEGVGIGSSSVK